MVGDSVVLFSFQSGQRVSLSFVECLEASVSTQALFPSIRGAALVGVTGDDNEDVAGSSRWSKGPTGAGIWQVGPDGQLTITWVDGEG